MSSKVVRIGIIGLGRSGRDIHGVKLAKMENFKIVAAVDPIADRRARAAQEYGCATYASHKQMFKRGDLDLVVNATPSWLHPKVTIEALDAGFNCLCEKPMARCVAEVDRMIAASKRNKRLLAVFQQSRFAPYFQQVKKVIDSGVLGRVVQVKIAFNGFGRRWDWQTLSANYGGNLLNTGPHPVDQALQLFGTDAKPEVLCIMDRANTFGDAEDHVKLILRGRDRPTIDLEISSCCAYATHTYNVYGTRGGMSGSMTHMDWKYFVPAEQPKQKLIRTPLRGEDGTPRYCGEQLVWKQESWDASEDQKGFEYMTGCFYSMLHRTLVDGVPLEITPQQVRQQIAVMEECHRQNPLAKMPKPKLR